MKKPSSSNNTPTKKTSDKKASDKNKDSGELRKPKKLTPLKEKDKKNWKSNLDDEEDFKLDEDVKLNENFEEDEEEFFDDDGY